MQTKRLTKLVSLSLQLYMLSRDERFRADIARLLSKLQRKAQKVVENMDEHKQETLSAVYHKIAEVTEGLEDHLKGGVRELYDKLHLATTDDLKKLSAEIEKLTAGLHALEERISKDEQEIE